ncbi:hypothetical protein [Streptomyces sp. NPDC001020]
MQEQPAAAQEGWTMRLAAEWECAVLLPDRDGDWTAAVEHSQAGSVTTGGVTDPACNYAATPLECHAVSS